MFFLTEKYCDLDIHMSQGDEIFELFVYANVFRKENHRKKFFFYSNHFDYIKTIQ